VNKDRRLIVYPYTRFDYISWGVSHILVATIAFLALRLKVDVLWVVLAEAGVSVLIL